MKYIIIYVKYIWNTKLYIWIINNIIKLYILFFTKKEIFYMYFFFPVLKCGIIQICYYKKFKFQITYLLIYKNIYIYYIDTYNIIYISK